MKKADQPEYIPRIVVVYCHNAVSPAEALLEGPHPAEGCEPFFAALPCSSKIEPSYLLKIIADGTDAVVVVACPEGACRFMTGNCRAEKRVRRSRELLESAGMGAERLALQRGDHLAARELLEMAKGRLETLKILGPNPMRGAEK
jgi:coenzyme F420-reducing hydrogenase delta subunit